MQSVVRLFEEQLAAEQLINEETSKKLAAKLTAFLEGELAASQGYQPQKVRALLLRCCVLCANYCLQTDHFQGAWTGFGQPASLLDGVWLVIRICSCLDVQRRRRAWSWRRSGEPAWLLLPFRAIS